MEKLRVGIDLGWSRIALAAAIVLASAPARADGPKAAPAAARADGYDYVFTDDPLAAGGLEPYDASIVVRKGAVRVTLIRPRTSFVPQMLASVENL